MKRWTHCEFIWETPSEPLEKTVPTFPVAAALAEMALNAADPAIETILKHLAKRQELHVRIVWRDGVNADGFVNLATRSFGDEDTWEYPYHDITFDKARKTARSGLTSRELHQMYPQFLDDKDGEYWGSAQRGNLIVACSGVEPEYDEAIANMVVGILWAIMQQVATPKAS